MCGHTCARKQTSRSFAWRARVAGAVLVSLWVSQVSTTDLANAASTPVVCRAVIVKVQAKRWVWVKKTRRIHGHRIVVRRHGKVVYSRVRRGYLRHKTQQICQAAASAPGTLVPGTPSLLPPSVVGLPIVTQSPAPVPSAAVAHLEYVLQDGVTSVYDMDHEFKLVKTISLPQTQAEVRGVTVAPSTHLMFIPYGGDGGGNGNGSVLALDLITEKVVWDAKLNTGIDSGQVSPDGKKLYIPTGELTSTALWNVLNAANGEVTGTIQGGTGPHNTVASSDGNHVYMAGRTSKFLNVFETATGKVREIGPLINTARPFTVNGSNTLAYTTATNFDGFQISSIATGKVLFTVSFGEVPKGFAFTAPSHGASLSPDESQLYVIDAVHKQVQFWDVSRVAEGVAPTQIGVVSVAGLTGSESPCAYDCGRGGWIQRSVDGRYLFVGDSGEVIDTTARNVVTTLATLAQTKKSIEVDWENGVPIATSERTGVGGTVQGAR